MNDTKTDYRNMNLFKKSITASEQSLIKLQEDFDALNLQFETVSNEVVSLTENLATVQGEFARVSEENKVLKEQLETANTEIVEVAKDAADIDEIATAKAIDIVASIGVPAVEIAEEMEEETDILTEFKSLKGKELQNFYNTHKQEIHRALKNG